MSALDVLGPASRTWFQETFEAPTQVQQRGWPLIAEGKNALLIAPTGSGKTLAAFLWCIDQLTRLEQDAAPGTRVLYVSPLKALVYDVERNLRAPLAGVQRTATRAQIPVTIPRVGIRTGDTSQRDRRLQLKNPSEILVTTPESLYLLLGSQAKENLRAVETVIVDEVHALAPTKRGAHLALSLERLSALCEHEPQRIGLSATAKPLDEVARYLGGGREVEIVDTSAKPYLDLQIVVPVEDMTNPVVEVTEKRADDDAAAGDAETDSEAPKRLMDEFAPPKKERVQGIWPAVHPRILELIRQHRTTIVFVNSRGLCERLTFDLNELAGEDFVKSHHGSLAHEQRKVIEEQLKAGQIRCIVATSSLELGIDMGAVDLVILVESPGAVASGLQRIGRAGHGVGEQSKGRLFPKHRGDLLEAAVVAKRMRDGNMEALRVPANPLDVLAQQIVAAVGQENWQLEELEALVRRAANYRDLPRDAFLGVLDMLSGRYPSNAFADLRPRIIWDRDQDVLSARKGARTLAAVSGGTIPDRGTYTVRLGDEQGARLGELDEEMVHETTAGQTFTLGTSTWRVEHITRDQVIVSPAPGETGKLPFWHGEGPGRPIELGEALGHFTRELDAKLQESRARAETWLVSDYGLDELAAKNLGAYVQEQRETAGSVPSDRCITVERFRDELGDWRVCILTPFGARIHAPWALAIGSLLGNRSGFEVQTMWSDDGIVLRFVEMDELPGAEVLLPSPDEVEDLVVSQVAESALFASQFRENASRSLLLPRRKPTERQPLWAQRLKAQELMAVARGFPAFPVVMETYRACLKDVFDLPALVELLRRVQRRDLRVEWVETPSPSPFARSLVFAYVAAYMYAGDTPVAERRAQALSLDRRLLAELLGQEDLRELLDAAVIDEIEAELQWLLDERQARHTDALHDLLRQVGDLTEQEVTARCIADNPKPWLQELQRSRRAVQLKVGGEQRWVAVEDVAAYRDGLGCAPPVGVPGVFLELATEPLPALFRRYARTHGPFTVGQLASRFRLPRGQVEAVLSLLERKGELLRGNMRPGGEDLQWCDAEVLRRIKRRTLARLRDEVEPVDARALARFLPQWHGVGNERRGLPRLEEIILQLEGLPLSYADLEAHVLPSRMAEFQPRMLDDLGASGWLVWVGHGALGAGDGRVAFYRRDQIAALLDAPQVPEELDELHHAILEHLGKRGACFFTELQAACKATLAGAPPRLELLEAIWDLVWKGLVTNDTLGPLRAMVKGGGKHRQTSARTRSRERGLPAAAGRWSLVRDLLVEDVSATEKAHARAITLLERHGVVSREVAGLEDIPGGFTQLYRVLRAMEEVGKVRRGYFIEGLGGAQFAFPGAVDQLRLCRHESEEVDVRLLSAVDPANPYGWVLPWPERSEDAPTPRRIGGASVVLIDGAPVLYVEKSGKGLILFPAALDDRELLVRALGTLEAVARQRRGKQLRVERIDGHPARTSPHAETLRQAGFGSDPKGLVLEV